MGKAPTLTKCAWSWSSSSKMSTSWWKTNALFPNQIWSEPSTIHYALSPFSMKQILCIEIWSPPTYSLTQISMSKLVISDYQGQFLKLVQDYKITTQCMSVKNSFKNVKTNSEIFEMNKITSVKSSKSRAPSEPKRHAAFPYKSAPDGIELLKFHWSNANMTRPQTCGASAASSMNFWNTQPNLWTCRTKTLRKSATCSKAIPVIHCLQLSTKAVRTPNSFQIKIKWM